MRDHSKLKVFQLADSLALLVYRHSRLFPADEKFGLTSQVRRAAVSIAANIVEGAARPSESDFARFLVVAYGSARELEYELSIATRLGYLTQNGVTELNDLTSQTGRALRALILTLQRSGRESASPHSG